MEETMTPQNHIDALNHIMKNIDNAYSKKKESEIAKEINRTIQKHERLIAILEAIKSFERRIEISIENLNGFPGTFISLQKKYINDIDTQKKCVTRLINLYYKNLNSINK